MSGCFWGAPTGYCSDDCIVPRAMLNLKTANLEGLTWASPPAASTIEPDTVYDLGEVDLLPDGPTSLFDAGAAITFEVPLRCVGGSFSIGTDTYGRPPDLGTKSLFVMATITMGSDFGWFDDVDPTPPTNGYLRSKFEFLDDNGAVVFSQDWCDMQSSDGTGYDDNPLGAFVTGQNTVSFGSYTIYPIVRAFANINVFPATDFDGGTLRFSLASSGVSSTGGDGAAMANQLTTPVFAAVGRKVAIKLIAASGTLPSKLDYWDF